MRRPTLHPTFGKTKEEANTRAQNRRLIKLTLTLTEGDERYERIVVARIRKVLQLSLLVSGHALRRLKCPQANSRQLVAIAYVVGLTIAVNNTCYIPTITRSCSIFSILSSHFRLTQLTLVQKLVFV